MNVNMVLMLVLIFKMVLMFVMLFCQVFSWLSTIRVAEMVKYSDVRSSGVDAATNMPGKPAKRQLQYQPAKQLCRGQSLPANLDVQPAKAD